MHRAKIIPAMLQTKTRTEPDSTAELYYSSSARGCARHLVTRDSLASNRPASRYGGRWGSVLVAGLIGVLLPIAGLSIGVSSSLRLGVLGQMAGAQEARPGGAQVKVKGVRTIPIDAPGYANVMAWAPDSRRLAVGGLLDKRVSVWDVRTGVRVPGPTADQNGGTHALAYSPDGLYLAVARGGVRFGGNQPMPTGPDRWVVSVWDGQSGGWVQNLADDPQEIATFGVRSMAFSPDSRYLAVSLTGGLALYANDGGTWRRTGALAPSVARLAFSPDGKRLIGTTGKELLMYEVPSGRVLSRWPGPRQGISAGFPSLAYRPDGNQVAAGDGVRLGFFNPMTGELVQALEPAAPYQVDELSYAPNSRYLAVALGLSAHLVDASSFATVAVLTEHRPSVDRLAVSPDGTMLAAIGGSVITIWELSGLERGRSK